MLFSDLLNKTDRVKCNYDLSLKKYNFFPSEFTFTGSMLNIANMSVKKSPSPTQYTACKTKSKHSLVKLEMQSPTQSPEKVKNASLHEDRFLESRIIPVGYIPTHC